MPGHGILFGVLGPIEVGHGAVDVHGMARRLLTALLVDANRVVPVHRLVEVLWGDEPPATAVGTLHSHVSRLRARLGALEDRVAVATREPGYVLEVDPDAIDSVRFERLVAAARATADAEEAVNGLDNALALWRGPAYAGLADEEFARPAAVRLEELRLSAGEERIDGLLRVGRHAEALSDIEQLVAANPLRENFRAQLMLARHRSGQSAAALGVYRDYRAQLAEELGLEPSARLQALEREVLTASTPTDLRASDEPAAVGTRQVPAPMAISTPDDAGSEWVGADVAQPAAAPPEPERKPVTVLLAEVDVPVSADGDPEEVLAALEPAVGAMREAVHRYEGTIHRLTGHGLAALFGAPVAQEDHAVRACYAGLALVDAVRAATGVPARVALQSGEVLVRTVRTDVSAEYEAVGAAVQLAEGLLAATPADAVSASAETVRLAAGRVEAREARESRKSLKSREGQTRRWTVLRATRRSPYEARTLRGLTAFAGRESELRLLAARLATAATERGQVVAVVGEAGVGKSRLCVEFQRRTVTPEWRSLTASAAPTESRSPYHPLAAMLWGWLNLPDDAPAEAVGAAVRAGPATAGRAAPLLALLGVPTGDAAWDALEPGQRRKRIHAAVVDFVLALAAEAPVLLVAEDLHWTDNESDAVLDALVEAAAAAPLLVLVTYRPEYLPRWVNHSSVTTLHLGPLRAAAADEVLASLLGDDASLADLKSQLLEWTGGSPLFLEETVRALAEARVLHGDPGRYRLVDRRAAVSVPTSVHAVLAARVDRLPPRQKALLQTAAVIGVSGSIDLLLDCVDASDDETEADLGELRRSEFLFERRGGPETTFTFKHAITHDAVYAGLPRSRRRRLHRQVGEAIRFRYGDRLGEHLARLGSHALGAEDWNEAARLLREAGERALDRSAHHEAAELLERAIEALGHLEPSPETVAAELDVRMALRPAVVTRGEMARSLDHLRRAEELARRVGDRARLVNVKIHQSFSHDLLGHVADAVAVADEGLAIARELGDDVLAAEVRLAMTQAYAMSGDAPRALAAIAPAFGLLTGDLRFERHGMAGIRGVWALGLPAMAHAVRGDFARAEALVGEAEEVARTGGRTVDRGFTAFASGFLELERGRPEAAIEALRAGEAITRDGDVPLAGMWNRAFLGRALTAVGDLAAAEAVLDRLLEQARANELILIEGWARTHLGELRLAQRSPDAAAAEGERAAALASRWRHPHTQARALRLLGEAAAARADGAGSEARFAAALAAGEGIGARPERAHVLAARGRARARAGEDGAARSDLGEALGVYIGLEVDGWWRSARRELDRLG